MRPRRFRTGWVMAMALLVVMSACAAWAQDVPRMTTSELKAKLGSRDVVILDVRTGRDWTSSEWKIQGAVREEPGELDSWLNKYEKGKTLVLYCA